jgi:hypothetical protein
LWDTPFLSLRLGTPFGGPRLGDPPLGDPPLG